MLTPEMQAKILTLHFVDRRSIRSIAREVGLLNKPTSFEGRTNPVAAVAAFK